jgi:electron transfer flavoprotein beta subunit
VNILVVLRMIPDAAGELQPGEDARDIDREWLDFQLNDFDDHALEEAILLKEATGARVIACATGEGANRVLQMAAARGADEVLALQGEADAMISSRNIASSVALLAKEKSADLIMCGVQSSEDVFGQLAPYVGALLDWPHVSGTNRVSADGSKLRVTQERGAGIAATYEVATPAVLGVQTASKAPRYVSGSKLREASKTVVGRAITAPSGFERFADIVTLRLPVQAGSGENLGSDADTVADRLLNILSSKGLARK